MMNDHVTLSCARQELVAALTALLKTDIMTAEDFGIAKWHAERAVGAIDDLLRQPDGDEA